MDSQMGWSLVIQIVSGRWVHCQQEWQTSLTQVSVTRHRQQLEQCQHSRRLHQHLNLAAPTPVQEAPAVPTPGPSPTPLPSSPVPTPTPCPTSSSPSGYSGGRYLRTECVTLSSA